MKFSCANDKRIEIFVEYQALSENLSKRLDKYSEATKTIPEHEIITIFKSVV